VPSKSASEMWAEVAASETNVGTRAADLGELADGVNGLP
jgi:hypothetical protein